MPVITLRLFRGDARSGGFTEYLVEAEEGWCSST